MSGSWAEKTKPKIPRPKIPRPKIDVRRPKPVAWHPLSPSEGLRRSLAAAATSPPRRPPLMGSVALQSVVCNEVSGCLGYLIPPRRSSFPSRPRGFPPVAVPHRLSPVGSSSRTLSVPPESLEPPPARPSRAPPLGLPPSSRRQPAESTRAGLPSPLRSVHGVSHAPDGFLLRLPCGFISPRSHVQGSLFRVFPSREAVRARRPPLPSCRSHRTPALSFIQWRQGTVPASRALLRSRVRGARWLFRPPPARYPPELSPSSGSPSRAARTTFVAPSDHGLSRPPSCYQRAT
jgi:hypothetical protein